MEKTKLIRQFLKEKLQEKLNESENFQLAWKNVYELFERTIKFGELNSALLIGSRGCGKTTLVSSVLSEILSSNIEHKEKVTTIYLNGFLHTDDNLAIQSIAAQLSLDENIITGKDFSSFTECLSFLLQFLKTENNDKPSKSVIFILEEFDMFCKHNKQILLYGLFDVIQVTEIPMCVLGITCRLDVIELLEKRVKSRFSHRQIFLFSPNDNFDNYIKSFGDYLRIQLKTDHLKSKNSNVEITKIPKLSNIKSNSNKTAATKYNFSTEYITSWNKSIDILIENSSNIKILQNLYNYDTSEAFLKNFIFKLVTKLNDQNEFIKSNDILSVYNEIESDDKVILLRQLSVLEICIIIAIKHHTQIFNRNQFNFEIIYNRLTKFLKISNVLQNIKKDAILKAFGRLQDIEFILPVSNSNVNKFQKKFHMYKLVLIDYQIDDLLKTEPLPTEVLQWAQSSLI